MTLITKPDFTYIWASGGAVVAPNDTKKQLGWVAEAPPFQYDNWLQNRQDQMLAHINQRGIPAWDGATNYEAGGLSYVQGSDGKVYKSVAASGPSATVQNPTTDVADTYWTIAFGDLLNRAVATVAASGTIDLTAGAPDTSQLAISGTGVSINGFTVAANRFFVVKMTGASNTLVDSASLVTGRGANIPVVAGDTFLMRSTASNTVEIVGGDFLIDRGIGSGQTLQEFPSPSRVIATTYTNTTGRSMWIGITFSGSGAAETAKLTVAGVDVYSGDPGISGDTTTASSIVAHGETYRVETNAQILQWVERR